MVFFECKKFIKKKNVFIILFFALLSAAFGILMQKQDNVSKFQFRVAEDQFAPYPMFLAMNSSEVTEEQKTAYEKAIQLNPTSQESVMLEMALKDMPLSDPTYLEQYHRLVQYTLDEFTGDLKLYDAMTTKNPKLKTEESERLAEVGRWENYKNQKIVSEGLQDPYYPTHLGGDNLVQAFLFQQENIFGVWQLLFFLVLFSTFYSREREQGTLSLLHTQAYSRRHILSAKAVVIAFGVLLYTIAAFLFFVAISTLRGMPFTGFQDMYRFITGEKVYTVIRGWLLLLQVMGVFFVTAFMVALFALFLSTRLSGEQALAVSLASFAILYVFTKNTTWFRHIANPIYGVQSFNVLLGYFALQTDAAGVTTLKQVLAFPWYKYGLYLLMALVFFLLSCFPKEQVSASRFSRHTWRISSLPAFEQKKSLLSQGALIYVLAFVILIVSNFFILSRIDHYTELENLGEHNSRLADYQDRIKEQQQALDDFDAHIAAMDSSKWSEEDKEEVKRDRDNYVVELENARDRLGFYQSMITAYKNKDGKEFYALAARTQQIEGNIEYVPGLANDFPSDFTTAMKQQLLQKASDQNCPPMFSFAPHVSALETHKDPSFIEKNSENAGYASHSASYLPFRLIRSHQLTLWIDALVLLIAGIGYANDREHGSQCAFLFTNGLSRRRYTLMKLFAQWGLGVAILLIGFLFVTLIGLVSGGIGDYNFPVTVYQEMATKTIPMWHYYLRWFIAMIGSITFIVSLQMALSLVIDNKAKLLGAFGLLTVIGLLFTEAFGPLKSLNPFIYMKSNVVADQSIAIIAHTNLFSYPIALAVLFGWSLLWLLLSCSFVNRLKVK